MNELGTAADPEPKAEVHQRVYSLLVEGPEDFLGIIAYSVYKQQKAEIIERFKGDPAKLTGELEAFYRLSKCESQRSFYKNQALELARKFVDNAAGEFIEEARTEIEDNCRKKFESYKPSFWANVGASVVAGVISIFLIGAAIFFVNSYHYGITDALQKGFGVKVTPAETDDTGAPAPPAR